MEQHARGSASRCGERLQFDVKSTRDREWIDWQGINSKFPEELIRLPTYEEELIVGPGQLLSLNRLLLGLMGQHLDEVVCHFLIFGREAGVVPVEGVDGGG